MKVQVCEIVLKVNKGQYLVLQTQCNKFKPPAVYSVMSQYCHYLLIPALCIILVFLHIIVYRFI